MINPSLAQANPQFAEFVENLQNRAEGNFNLSEGAEQARFYEATAEICRAIAMHSHSANVQVSVSSEGIASITISANPRLVKSSQAD